MRPVDGDPHAEFAVEVVLTRHRVVVDVEVEICLMFGHPPDPLTALHRDQGTDGEIPDVLSRAGVLHTHDRSDEAAGLGAPCARERDAVLDISADIGRAIVDDRDDEHPATVRQPEGVQLVAGQERLRRVAVAREAGHQRRRVLGVHRQDERDPVDTRVASGLLVLAFGDAHADSSWSIWGKTSMWARSPKNMSRWP